MNLAVREMEPKDIPLIIDYFYNADAEFLAGMGADKNRLPGKREWHHKLEQEYSKPFTEKEHYYIIWLEEGKAIGHSSLNEIVYGHSAKMHLHLWSPSKRKRGLGKQLLSLTLPHYFSTFKLRTLICEPYAANPAPNRTLPHLGFVRVKTYATIPGKINFYQAVHQYELKRQDHEKRAADI